MLKINKKAFSILEIVIATWILTLTFFWVYKLIWENTKIITNSSIFMQANILEKSLETCIKNIWYNYFKNNNQTKYFFNLWNSWTTCNTWNTIITQIDNIPYFFSWNITNSWSNFIQWNLRISSDSIWSIQKNFTQLKQN